MGIQCTLLLISTLALSIALLDVEIESCRLLREIYRLRNSHFQKTGEFPGKLIPLGGMIVEKRKNKVKK
jgi:hypothetical protein